MHLWLIITSLSFLLELQVRKSVERAAICLSVCLPVCLRKGGRHLQMNQELLQSWLFQCEARDHDVGHQPLILVRLRVGRRRDTPRLTGRWAGRQGGRQQGLMGKCQNSSAQLKMVQEIKYS